MTIDFDWSINGGDIVLSHRMNGDPEDLVHQQVELVGFISSGLSEVDVGIFSHAKNVHPDTPLVRRFGFWRRELGGLRDGVGLAARALDFNYSVSGGLCPLGLMIVKPDVLPRLMQLAENLGVVIFFWSKNVNKLIEALANEQGIPGQAFRVDGGRCFISFSCLEEIARATDTCFLMLDLSVDVLCVELKLIDPAQIISSLIAI